MTGDRDEADSYHLIKCFTPSSHFEWGGGSQGLLMKWASSLYKLVYHALEEKFFYEYEGPILIIFFLKANKKPSCKYLSLVGVNRNYC